MTCLPGCNGTGRVYLGPNLWVWCVCAHPRRVVLPPTQAMPLETSK